MAEGYAKDRANKGWHEDTFGLWWEGVIFEISVDVIVNSRIDAFPCKSGVEAFGDVLFRILHDIGYFLGNGSVGGDKFHSGF